VSRHVAELEARLGVRLLYRTTRKLSLTPEGEVFHARWNELLSTVDEAETDITQATQTGAYGEHMYINTGYPLSSTDPEATQRKSDMLRPLAGPVGRLAATALLRHAIALQRRPPCRHVELSG